MADEVHARVRQKVSSTVVSEPTLRPPESEPAEGRPYSSFSLPSASTLAADLRSAVETGGRPAFAASVESGSKMRRRRNWALAFLASPSRKGMWSSDSQTVCLPTALWQVFIKKARREAANCGGL